MAKTTNLTITNFVSNDNVKCCPQEKKPEYAFIGRSNVGKSSLINMILNHKISYTSSKPGRTQSINHILVNNSWHLVDLPGYGYAKIAKTKRTQILKMSQNYFTSRTKQLIAVFILIDIRIPPQKIDLDWMEWLTKNKLFFIRVFTKSDGINTNQITNSITTYDNFMLKTWTKTPETIITSSKSRSGRDDMLMRILELNKLFQNI